MKRLVLIAVACLALVVVGCGGSDGDPASSSEDAAAAEATTTESSTPESTTGESTAAESFPAPEEPGSAAAGSAAANKTKPKVTVPKGVSPKKFVFRDLEEGTGATAEKGDKLTVEYVGVGYDSKAEFESTWETRPYTFTLGAGEALPSIEKGIEGMKEGGRRELIIPGKFAYGAEGRPPKIGPNETLVFVVDLLAVE